IEPILLDDQLLDGGELFLLVLGDVSREAVDLFDEPLQRALRADEVGREIALPREEGLQMSSVEIGDPIVIRKSGQWKLWGRWIARRNRRFDVAGALRAQGGNSLERNRLVGAMLGLDRPGDVGTRDARCS